MYEYSCCSTSSGNVPLGTEMRYIHFGNNGRQRNKNYHKIQFMRMRIELELFCLKKRLLRRDKYFQILEFILMQC